MAIREKPRDLEFNYVPEGIGNNPLYEIRFSEETLDVYIKKSDTTDGVIIQIESDVLAEIVDFLRDNKKIPMPTDMVATPLHPVLGSGKRALSVPQIDKKEDSNFNSSLSPVSSFSVDSGLESKDENIVDDPPVKTAKKKDGVIFVGGKEKKVTNDIKRTVITSRSEEESKLLRGEGESDKSIRRTS
jgi:hypothetical protein